MEGRDTNHCTTDAYTKIEKESPFKVLVFKIQETFFNSLLSYNFMAQPVERVFFDQDLTLVSVRPYQNAYPATYERVRDAICLNNDFRKDEFRLDDFLTEQGFRDGLPGMFEMGAVCDRYGLNSIGFNCLKDELENGEESVFPPARLVLNELTNIGMPMSVISDSFLWVVLLRLGYGGIGHYFESVFTPDFVEGHVKKINPLYWETLIDELAVDPNTTLMVGDHPEKDIKMAESFGFQTYHVKKPADLLNILGVIDLPSSRLRRNPFWSKANLEFFTSFVSL